MKGALNYLNLLAVLFPGIAFCVCLFLVRDQPEYHWVSDISAFPPELFVIALFGSFASSMGIADWLFHRALGARVGRKERECEAIALMGGGLPLFFLMAAASVLPRPSRLLIPILVCVLFTTVAICYDELTFHRHRCKRLETFFHRGLVLGNAVAWLAWMHWCFERQA